MKAENNVRDYADSFHVYADLNMNKIYHDVGNMFRKVCARIDTADKVGNMFHEVHDQIDAITKDLNENAREAIRGQFDELAKEEGAVGDKQLQLFSILDFLLSGSDKYVEFRQHHNPRDTKEFIIQKLQNIVKKFSPELQRIVNDKLENDKLGAKEERLAEARIGFEFSGDKRLALENAILQALLHPDCIIQPTSASNSIQTSPEQCGK